MDDQRYHQLDSIKKIGFIKRCVPEKTHLTKENLTKNTRKRYLSLPKTINQAILILLL